MVGNKITQLQKNTQKTKNKKLKPFYIIQI